MSSKDLRFLPARTIAPAVAPSAVEAAAPVVVRNEAALPKRWGEDDAEQSKDRDARALFLSQQANDAEIQKLAREKAAREKQYLHWDKWRESPAFLEYLFSRGLKLRDVTKGLPRSPHMEYAALGAMMMLQEDPVTVGMRRLHPAHFGDLSVGPVFNAQIFVAITRLETARRANPGGTLKSIDPLTVCDEMLKMGVKSDNLFSAVTARVDECACFQNIDYYIEKVIEKSRLRHLFALGEKLQDATTIHDAESARLQNAAQNALAAINTHGWCDLKTIFEKEK